MIGIAVRGDAACDEFRRALDPLRTDIDGTHNYTVWFSADPLKFHRLQWGGCTVVRTRDPNRFARALALHLSGHGAPSAGLLRTAGVVAVHDGQATVLPAALRQAVPTYDRPLRKERVVLSDAPWVDLDPQTGEVVVESPRLASEYLAEVSNALRPADRPDMMVEPGRYPLTAWYFGSLKRTESQMSVADAVAAVLAGLRSAMTSRVEPAALAALFDRVVFGRDVFGSPRELLEHMGR